MSWPTLTSCPILTKIVITVPGIGLLNSCPFPIIVPDLDVFSSEGFSDSIKEAVSCNLTSNFCPSTKTTAGSEEESSTSTKYHLPSTRIFICYTTKEMKTPAITADPITPATFGPIAWGNKKLLGLAC